MPRRVLYLLFAVALGVGIYLYVRGGDDDATPPDGAGGNTGVAGDRGGGSPGKPPPTIAQPRPRTGDPADPDDPAGRGGTRTSVTDTGNLVRDHRGDVENAVALPAPMPPGERTMNPTLSGDLYRQLAPLVRKCGVEAPSGGRGDSPVAHVTLTVDVTAGQLRTIDATAVTSDLPAAASDQLIACVRDRAAALTIPANGEPDRTGYVLQFPIRLRK
jgi:hypothetical protein